MKVQEIMTQEVVTVDPETNLRDASGILAYYRISGLPVRDATGELVGNVSEDDILLREAGVRDERRLFARLRSSKTNKKARALTVEDAMTAPVVTISPHASVAEAARRMSDLGIKRLPVVKGHALVGIVSRGDLVRAFVRSDREIRHEIIEDLIRRTLWLEVPEAVQVQVEHGAVRLSGQVETATDALLLQKLVARVPGVVCVHAELGWRSEDADRRRELERLQLTAAR